MKKIISILAVSLALSACDNNDVGNKFVGKWYQGGSNYADVSSVTISRSGDKFKIQTDLPLKNYCGSEATLVSSDLVCNPQAIFQLDTKQEEITFLDEGQAGLYFHKKSMLMKIFDYLRGKK